jgi:hypothetical protein
MQETRNRGYKKLFLYIVLILVIAGVAAAGWWYSTQRDISPVPENIQKSVSFPVYYPDPKKLPVGYTLDASSFKNPVKDGITYNVNYGGGRLVFSVQPKPSTTELDSFTASYIPLNNNYQTPIGQAELGAYNNGGKAATETLVSLPTDKNVWIIVTAPYNVNQDQLKEVLSSLSL